MWVITKGGTSRGQGRSLAVNCRPASHPYLYTVSSQPQKSPNQEAAGRLRAQAQGLFGNGDLEAAQRLLAQAIDLDPTAAEGHYLLGNCLRRLRLTEGAEGAFKAALERDPNLAPAWFGLAFLYEETGRREDAADQLRRMSAHFAGDAETLHKAGGLMGEFGLYKDAAELYERIIEREPQARNHLRLGQYYQKIGRYDDAERSLLAAIDANPDAGAAYLLLANSHRFTRSAEDQALQGRFAQAIAAGSPSRTTRICLNFALGKIHDDLEEYDQAFNYFTQGNGLRRSEQSFSAMQWQELVTRIESVGKLPALPAEDTAGPAPVFVVGMLRSGTTLVERILASHPQVRGLGEIDWLSDAITRLTQEAGRFYPEILSTLTASNIADVRRDYERRWPKSEAPRYFVDKNPINFIYLGLIARVFPGARIVHCVRDARDTGLSIYFQNFAHSMHSYAYDLADIAHYHNGYARIMRHWERVLPAGMMHTVRYEDLVSEQERETRSLLASLDLPWDAACLGFDKQTDAISTASVWQARQPLYAQSVGRWQHYQRHLGPLLNTLAE